jgi:histidyl-tRNA synthetase
VGSSSPAADAEMCMMAADTMEALGIPRGDYVVRVNNRMILDGVMDANGLHGDNYAAQRLAVLRAIDTFDRLGIQGVRDRLGAGREDKSGDVTKGAGLNAEQIEFIEQTLFSHLAVGQWSDQALLNNSARPSDDADRSGRTFL